MKKDIFEKITDPNNDNVEKTIYGVVWEDDNYHQHLDKFDVYFDHENWRLLVVDEWGNMESVSFKSPKEMDYCEFEEINTGKDCEIWDDFFDDDETLNYLVEFVIYEFRTFPLARKEPYVVNEDGYLSIKKEEEKRKKEKEKYDPKTAEFIAYRCSDADSFIRYEESLYRTQDGEYFLDGEGGALSKYAQYCEDGSLGAGKDIIPLSKKEAIEWAKKYDKWNKRTYREESNLLELIEQDSKNKQEERER